MIVLPKTVNSIRKIPFIGKTEEILKSQKTKKIESRFGRKMERSRRVRESGFYKEKWKFLQKIYCSAGNKEDGAKILERS